MTAARPTDPPAARDPSVPGAGARRQATCPRVRPSGASRADERHGPNATCVGWCAEWRWGAHVRVLRTARTRSHAARARGIGCTGRTLSYARCTVTASHHSYPRCSVQRSLSFRVQACSEAPPQTAETRLASGSASLPPVLACPASRGLDISDGEPTGRTKLASFVRICAFGDVWALRSCSDSAFLRTQIPEP